MGSGGPEYRIVRSAPETERAEWGENPREWVTVKPDLPDQSDTSTVDQAPAVTGTAFSPIGALWDF